jgi:hypothetical protein
MSKESHSLPQSTFVCEMQHKYAVGDKVRVIKEHMMSGSEGVISALIPFTFLTPGYYVTVNGMVFGASEQTSPELR